MAWRPEAPARSPAMEVMPTSSGPATYDKREPTPLHFSAVEDITEGGSGHRSIAAGTRHRRRRPTDFHRACAMVNSDGAIEGAGKEDAMRSGRMLRSGAICLLGLAACGGGGAVMNPDAGALGNGERRWLDVDRRRRGRRLAGQHPHGRAGVLRARAGVAARDRRGADRRNGHHQSGQRAGRQHRPAIRAGDRAGARRRDHRARLRVDQLRPARRGRRHRRHQRLLQSLFAVGDLSGRRPDGGRLHAARGAVPARRRRRARAQRAVSGDRHALSARPTSPFPI